MGTYATTTSLETLMVGVSFDTATSALASKLITHSENEINKYISKRYDISQFSTSTSVPPLLTSLCETLAEGYLWQRNARGNKEEREHGRALVKDAVDNLKLIQDYKSDLVNSSGAVIADFSNTSYRVLGNTENYSPTFNEDDELNWAISQDKLDAIADERDS